MNNKNLYILIIIVSVFIISACGNNENKLPSELINNPITAEGSTSIDKLPVINFKTTEHDFGKIQDGIEVSYKFKFTNTGKGDLLISQVKTSCGCTASRFPKKVIKPGESNFIELTFNSIHRSGFNHKTATVLANTQPNTTTLSIKATVINDK